MPQFGTLEGALARIQSHDTIATPIYGNEPSAFLQQLHTIAPRVQGVVLWTMLTMGEYPVMTDNTLQGHIDIYTFFYNNNCRHGPVHTGAAEPAQRGALSGGHPAAQCVCGLRLAAG